VLTGLAALQGLLRVVLFWSALAMGAIAVLDWMVRTRRLNPFGPVARLVRTYVDPVLAPVERRVVRAGGLPATAPWWALAAVVIGGILVIALFDFVIRFLASASASLAGGAQGIIVLLVSWTFGLLELAILVRVVVSWLPVSQFSPWVRWAFVLSEPILRPLRRFIPTIGNIDITPIVAFFGLSILQGIVVGMLV